jgi:hypothetical protein
VFSKGAQIITRSSIVTPLVGVRGAGLSGVLGSWVIRVAVFTVRFFFGIGQARNDAGFVWHWWRSGGLLFFSYRSSFRVDGTSLVVGGPWGIE